MSRSLCIVRLASKPRKANWNSSANRAPFFPMRTLAQKDHFIGSRWPPCSDLRSMQINLRRVAGVATRIIGSPPFPGTTCATPAIPSRRFKSSILKCSSITQRILTQGAAEPWSLQAHLDASRIKARPGLRELYFPRLPPRIFAILDLKVSQCYAFSKCTCAP